MNGSRRAGRLVLCALLACGTAAAGIRGDQPRFPGEIAWHTDLDAAHLASRTTGRPMLLVFESESCPHCAMLGEATLGHPQVVYYVGSRFVLVRLSVDEAPPAARVLGVTSVPTSIVLSPEADLLGRIVGAVEARQYVGLLESSRRLHARLQQVGGLPPRAR